MRTDFSLKLLPTDWIRHSGHGGVKLAIGRSVTISYSVDLTSMIFSVAIPAVWKIMTGLMVQGTPCKGALVLRDGKGEGST
jgi:hypothetical protein